MGEPPTRAATPLCAEKHPDIILLDIDLGETDGLDLLPKLLSAAPQARVVVLMGVLDPEIHRKLGVTDRLELVIYAYRHGLTRLAS